MKVTIHKSPSIKEQTVRAGLASVSAFTLVEMMVTMAVFLLAVAAMLGVQIFGMKMGLVSQSKLNATNYSLKSLDQIRNAVREASNFYVGNYASNNFVPITGTNQLTGNALQVSNGPTAYMTFFVSTNMRTLYEQVTNSTQWIALAHSVTNTQVFQEQNCFGAVMSSGSGNATIQITLQFFQTNFYNMVDSYELQTRMTPRVQ